MTEAEMAAKSLDSIQDAAKPTVEDDIRVFYYPSDEEFNIWMVAMIAMGSLFLVFVGVTIYLICTTKNDPSRNKNSTSVMTHRPSEYRTARTRQASQHVSDP